MKSRNTIQKNIILDTVHKLKNHPSAEEIYLEIAKENSTISRATVYRNLKQMAEKKEILRIQIPNSADRYDFFTQNHNHIKCEKCGKVYDIEVSQINILDAVKDSRFDIMGYELVFRGICIDCKKGIEYGQ